MTSSRIRPSYRRSPSLSSTSSSSLGSMSFFLDDSSVPATPLRYFGIPFSWEQFPGIPKKNNTKKDSSQSLLPLPPSGNSFRKSFGKDTGPMLKKYSTSESFHKDPFFAAFVECSKDEELVKGSKIRSTSGLANVYSSCKRTCEVAESIVYLPRSRAGYFHR
ncbi:uncharacterized protein LOC111898176 [Lactuca sativa]|uniref:uncharacterized protein LOC111898176 n=1 Tax=Lactuca sativa TaxID=4236 RepID=UPI000CD836E7|nr:uncharacterized protein LOC111898176 [Lactuca sativa]